MMIKIRNFDKNQAGTSVGFLSIPSSTMEDAGRWLLEEDDDNDDNDDNDDDYAHHSNLPPTSFPHCETIECGYFVHAGKNQSSSSSLIIIMMMTNHLMMTISHHSLKRC